MATNVLVTGSHSGQEDEYIRELAKILAGYDDTTWMRLRRGRKLTYVRAATNLCIRWNEVLTGKMLA